MCPSLRILSSDFTFFVDFCLFVFSEDAARAYETMVQIAKINRISTVLLLMGKEDKAVAASICNSLQSNETVDKNGLRSLAKVFEVDLA